MNKCAQQEASACGWELRIRRTPNNKAPELYVAKNDTHTHGNVNHGEDGVETRGSDGVAMAKLTQCTMLRTGCSVPRAPHFHDCPRHVNQREAQVGILVAQHEEACRTG